MAHIVSVGDMLKFQPGPLSLPPPPTGAQAALSSQLAALAAQMHEISSRLNALSLPASLPPEILLEVFLTHAARVQREHLDGVYDDHKHSRRVGSYFKWIRVAHVCRYWREVALSSAEFKAFCVFEAWSVPKGGEPLDIPTGFWRYHPHTVVYHQNMDHKCPRCTWNYTHTCGIHHITIHAKRVRHLAIIIEADDGTALLWDRLRAAAWSELESFRIGLRGDAWGYHTSGFAARLTIPDDLFASSTPRLRSLTTSHVSFSFASAMLRPSLRHLEITAHPGHEAHRDMQDLISTLKNLQSLETLAMDCLPIVPSEPFTGEAYLPRLALLRLTTEFQRAAVFLSHVRIPGTTSVVLALKPRAECLAPPPAFIEELSKIAKAAPLCTASWSISPNNAGFCRDQSSLRAWAAVRPPVDELWVSKPDTAPRLTINGHTHGLIIDILGALDLPHLTSLHLKGPMPAQEAWARAFKRAPKVTLLRVTGRVGFQLGTGLSVAMGDQAGEGRRSASCALPQLRMIQFVDVLFPPPHEGNAAYPFAGADVCCEKYETAKRQARKRGIDVKDLVRGLQRRRGLGADAVQRVEFVGCPNMKMTHMRQLLREDVEVVFDGQLLSRSQ